MTSQTSTIERSSKVKTSPEQPESAIDTKLIWEQLLNSNPGPSNAQLCYLVIHSEQMGGLAFDHLLLQNPTNSELYRIMRDAKADFKEKAFERLVSQKEPFYAYIVSTVIQIDELEETAWKKFIELGPQGDELRLIAENKASLREECWTSILSQEISNDELIHVMQDYSKLRDLAWDRLMKREYNNRELCRIIEHVKELRQKAWREFLKRSPTNTELRYLIDHVPEVRDIAEYKLYKETEEVMKILQGLQ